MTLLTGSLWTNRRHRGRVSCSIFHRVGISSERRGTGEALVGLGDLGFLARLRPVSAEEAQLDPKVVRLSPTSSRWCGCSKRRRARSCWKKSPRASEGAQLSRTAGRAAAGRRAERPAAARGGLQVPRGAGRELGPPGQPVLARRASLAADLLGARLLQRRRRPQDVQEGDWTMAPVDEAAVPPARQGPAGVHRGDGRLGRSGRRRRGRRPGPHGRRERDLRAVLSATAPATSARSATRRSTWPTACARSSASAGNTPSRCCGRWPTPC